MAMVEESAGGDARLTLALERSWKAVEAQRGLLSDFRSRSATLLSAASVTVGVSAGLGSNAGLTLTDGWARWSVGWFATSMVCAIIVLVPYRWVFESDPSTFGWYFENATAEELRSSLLADAVKHHRNNDSKLRWLGWVLTVQVVALGLTAIGVLSIFVGR
ncbi:MAG: hypothetical protein ACE37B_11360 [Ilumatobacter sp.]|uniref:hypothetical protein n=1 Tax=Ilumatobacter sp. TaxID=1967498 RepID=UPI00391A7990